MKKTAVFLLTAPIVLVHLNAQINVGWLDMGFGIDQTGSATVSESGGMTNITLTGTGTDIWGTFDSGRFAFTPMVGDCEIIATVPAIPKDAGYGQWARIGLMMRGSLAGNAQNMAFLRAASTDSTVANGSSALKCSRRPTNNTSSSNWTGFTEPYAYADEAPARMRLVRQGDTFTAWISDNAPGYDNWTRIATNTESSFTEGLNVGVTVSRWTKATDTPDTLSCVFDNVKLHPLVAAHVSASDVALTWVDDLPVAEGTVTGYAVSRALLPSSEYEELGQAATAAYTDTTVVPGAAYRYRVERLIDIDNETSRDLVGTSLPARPGAIAANPTPASVTGVYAEYYEHHSGAPTPELPVSARVEPSISNTWTTTADVYPAGASAGLGDVDYFNIRYNGNLIVPETGCYLLAENADDYFTLTVDGQVLLDQTAYWNNLVFPTAPIWLEAGRSYPLQITFRENSGGEFAVLHWYLDGGTREILTKTNLEPFPLPWQHRDIGESPLFGNAIFDNTAQTFTIHSGGSGTVSDKHDDFHFVWRESATDFDFIATVAPSAAPAAGAGLVIRQSLAADAAFFMVGVTTVDSVPLIAVVERAEAGTDAAILAAIPISAAQTIDLRLSRRGSEMWAAYRANAASGWVTVTNHTTALIGTLLTGMGAFSGDTALTASATFSNITFADTAFTFSAAVANGQAVVSAPTTTPKLRQDVHAKSNVAYFWSDADTTSTLAFGVYRADRPDVDGDYVAELTAANSYTFAEPMPAANTLVFYRLDSAFDFGPIASGEAIPALTFNCSPFGISDGSIAGTGTGLYASFTRDSNATYRNIAPAINIIRGLGQWEKGTGNTPIVAVGNSPDGIQIGPDNFQGTWAGWITPTRTGYHWFNAAYDDCITIWINGKMLLDQWAWSATPIQSDAIWLEAGQRYPIHVYFRQGTGGGFLRVNWKNGLGYGGGFEYIPDIQLYPLAATSTPHVVAPGTSAVFGNWINADINTGCPGHAVLSGTPEAFDCVVAGSGADIWGTSDGLHYVYQSVSGNFEFEATLVDSFNIGDDWLKAGLMVRGSTDANARNVAIFQSYGQGRVMQIRSADGATSSNTSAFNSGQLNEGSNTFPVTFKIESRAGKLRFYVDGKYVPFSADGDVSLADWNKPFLVGLAVTAHNNGRITDTLFTDVTFKTFPPRNLVLFLK